MLAGLTNWYPWIKAAHVVFVIFWMAGLFMLPRFYAYHQEARTGTSEWKAWEERERRLIRLILNPALVIVWILGIALLWITGVGREGWFHVKFAAVGLLVLYHLWMVELCRAASTRRQACFQPDACECSTKYPGWWRSSPSSWSSSAHSD